MPYNMYANRGDTAIYAGSADSVSNVDRLELKRTAPRKRVAKGGEIETTPLRTNALFLQQIGEHVVAVSVSFTVPVGVDVEQTKTFVGECIAQADMLKKLAVTGDIILNH